MSIISVVIPTKNRHKLLSKILTVLDEQTYLPVEVVIVDQTINKFGETMTGFRYVARYYHQPEIGSLCEAKNFGLMRAKAAFICFLDDDSRPAPDFLEKLLSGMIEVNAMGMCGFVTNYEYQSTLMRIVYPIFHRGYFKGNRMGVFGITAVDKLSKHIQTHQITGGCSIWRREVFDEVSFDLENKFHLFEDIDFSFRVNQVFPGRLFINTQARIEDLYKQVGERDFHGRMKMRMLETRKVFKKYKKRQLISHADYIAYVFGRALEAIMISIKIRSFSPLSGYTLGLISKLTER